MKTIEERADEYVGHPFKIGEDTCDTFRRFAYTVGATEQRKIDIDKAWQWIENNLFPSNSNGIDIWERDFRKAMEK